MFTMMDCMAVVNPPISRREKARAATKTEILDAARHLLLSGGVEKVTQRGIASAMGVTAPALYRYFDSREAILTALIQQLYDELTAHIVDLDNPAEDARTRFRSAAHGFRRWALDHRAEFGLLFGEPIPGIDMLDIAAPFSGDMKFCTMWLSLFLDLVREEPSVVPSDDTVDPRLAQQLEPLLTLLQGQLTVGAAVLFLRGWMRMYGAVAIEVFGHMRFALQDAELLFDDMITELGET